MEKTQRSSAFGWLASLLGRSSTFKMSRCKKLLTITMTRVQLLKSRREVQVRQSRQDVAHLIWLGGERCQKSLSSRLRIAWNEEKLLAAYTKIGEYCQIVMANLSNVTGHRECPMELREPIANLCYAASFCADLPELQEIREMFSLRYGRDIIRSPKDFPHSCQVDESFAKLLSQKMSSHAQKQALLDTIVEEYKIPADLIPPYSISEEGLHDNSGFAKRRSVMTEGHEANGDGNLMQNAAGMDDAVKEEVNAATKTRFQFLGVARLYSKKSRRKRDAQIMDEVRNDEQNDANHQFPATDSQFSGSMLVGTGESVDEVLISEHETASALQTGFPENSPPSSQPPKRAPPPPYRLAANSEQSHVPHQLPSSTSVTDDLLQKPSPYVHPRLPQYDDFVAKFAALKQKTPKD